MKNNKKVSQLHAFTSIHGKSIGEFSMLKQLILNVGESKILHGELLCRVH